MGEYVKVEGYHDLVKDTETHAVINTNKSAYLMAKRRAQEAQKQRDAIRNATREINNICLLYTSPSPRDGLLSRMPSSA